MLHDCVWEAVCLDTSCRHFIGDLDACSWCLPGLATNLNLWSYDVSEKNSVSRMTFDDCVESLQCLPCCMIVYERQCVWTQAADTLWGILMLYFHIRYCHPIQHPLSLCQHDIWRLCGEPAVSTMLHDCAWEAVCLDTSCRHFVGDLDAIFSYKILSSNSTSTQSLSAWNLTIVWRACSVYHAAWLWMRGSVFGHKLRTLYGESWCYIFR